MLEIKRTDTGEKIELDKKQVNLLAGVLSSCQDLEFGLDTEENDFIWKIISHLDIFPQEF